MKLYTNNAFKLIIPNLVYSTCFNLNELCLHILFTSGPKTKHKFLIHFYLSGLNFIYFNSKNEPNLQFIRALILVSLFLIYFISKMGLCLQVMKMDFLVG